MVLCGWFLGVVTLFSPLSFSMTSLVSFFTKDLTHEIKAIIYNMSIDYEHKYIMIYVYNCTKLEK